MPAGGKAAPLGELIEGWMDGCARAVDGFAETMDGSMGLMDRWVGRADGWADGCMVWMHTWLDEHADTCTGAWLDA